MFNLVKIIEMSVQPTINTTTQVAGNKPAHPVVRFFKKLLLFFVLLFYYIIHISCFLIDGYMYINDWIFIIPSINDGNNIFITNKYFYLK